MQNKRSKMLHKKGALAPTTGSSRCRFAGCTAMASRQADFNCSLSSELDTMEAMTRRSLASDAAGLIYEYETFQKWVQSLFQLLRQACPSWIQSAWGEPVVEGQTDEPFVRMQELTREGIKPRR